MQDKGHVPKVAHNNGQSPLLREKAWGHFMGLKSSDFFALWA